MDIPSFMTGVFVGLIAAMILTLVVTWAASPRRVPS